jgi:hypothetical protein
VGGNAAGGGWMGLEERSDMWQLPHGVVRDLSRVRATQISIVSLRVTNCT